MAKRHGYRGLLLSLENNSTSRPRVYWVSFNILQHVESEHAIHLQQQVRKFLLGRVRKRKCK